MRSIKVHHSLLLYSIQNTMEYTIQIVALVLGLLIYWYLRRRDKPKTLPKQSPETVSPPKQKPEPPEPEPEPESEPEPASEDDDDEEGEEAPPYDPVTFEELLAQYGRDGKKSEERRVWERRAKEAREQALRDVAGINEEFTPAVPNPPKKIPGLQRHSLLSDKDLHDVRDEAFRLHRGKGSSHFAKLLRNPHSLRDAIIMKEILERKYFDI